MKEIHKIWQRKWREALGESTDEMPDDVREDYVLHFDIWNLDSEKLEECFSLFPNGCKVLQRAKKIMTTQQQKIDVSSDVLLNLLDEMNTSIDTVLKQYGDRSLVELNNEKQDCQASKIYRGDRTLRSQLFNQADSPTLHLDDELREVVKSKLGETGETAFFFLSEPLYRLAGNNYALADWALWAFVDEYFNADPYNAGYELYQMKAMAGWSPEEMFVFIED